MKETTESTRRRGTPRKKPVILTHTEKSHPITPGTDPEFLRCLKLGLLQGLREQGILDDAQLANARALLGGGV